MKHVLAVLWCSALIGAVVPACVYDPDQRCGPNQVMLHEDRCSCEPGFVPGTAGCEPCGENEEESQGKCVCVDGYSSPADGAACEVIPNELGVECDTASAPCADGAYSLCHVTDGTSGYCTNACTSSSDCDGGYACHEAGDDSFCRRPPVGYGDSCDSHADCADGEATFCETIQARICLVPCSAGKTDGCFEGELCCNFVLFEPICVPSDSCTSQGGTEVQ